MAFSLNIFLIASILFLTDALKNEANQLLKASPDLIIQNLKGGRHELIPVEYVEKIKRIRGIRQVVPRCWGYYYDPPTTANYTFMGVEKATPQVGTLIDGNYHQVFRENPQKFGNFRPCIIGEGIAEVRLIGVDDIIPVRGSDGEVHVLKVVGVFKSASEILTNDLVVLHSENLRKIFGIPENMATDIVVSIRNSSEIDTIARKIQAQMPGARIISKSQILSTYEAMFGWRSGLMVALIIGSVAAFAILSFDKASGLSAGEKKEIGTLKAVGWETSEVLEMKFWQGFVISTLSFLTGAIAAYVHVFFFGCAMFSPVLSGWSVLFPAFHPIPRIDLYQFCTIIFLTVVPYITATLIPSWKAAITDPDMVMR